MKDYSDKKSMFMGFVITRECVGKFGTSFRYRCGKEIAPRRKDIEKIIERVVVDLERLESES